MATIWYEPSLKNNVIENNVCEYNKTKVREIKDEVMTYIKKQARKELYTTRSFGISPDQGLILMVAWGALFIAPAIAKDIVDGRKKKQEELEKAEREYLKIKLEDEKLKLEELKLMKEYAELQKSFIVNDNQDVEGMF